MLQHRLAHDDADQLLDGARQVIVVNLGEAQLEVDVVGNKGIGAYVVGARCLGGLGCHGCHVPRCLPPLRLAPRTTPSQLTRQRPPPTSCHSATIVSTLLTPDFAARALKMANYN